MDWLRKPQEILAVQDAKRNAQEEEKRLVEERVKKEEEKRTARLMAVWEKLQIDRIIEDVRNAIWPSVSISETKMSAYEFYKKIGYEDSGNEYSTSDNSKRYFSISLDGESVRLHAEGSLYKDSYLLEEITDTETLQEKVEKLLVDKLQGTRRQKAIVGGGHESRW